MKPRDLEQVSSFLLDMSKSVAAPKDVKPTLIPMVRTAAGIDSSLPIPMAALYTNSFSTL